MKVPNSPLSWNALTVFGSYLTDKERPGDLDAVVELKRRFADQALQEDA